LADKCTWLETKKWVIHFLRGFFTQVAFSLNLKFNVLNKLST